MPLKLLDWIDDNREHLKPPVCNKQMFEDSEFIVQVVGGPNSRSDYHVDEGPELFYQVEGEMLLKTVQDGEFVDIPIGEGEIFLLPPRMPHSPQRFKDTVGIVVERQPCAARARRLPLVLPEVREQAARGVSARRRHREGPAARVRALLCRVRRAHLQALRHRRAAEMIGGRARLRARRAPPRARSTLPTSSLAFRRRFALPKDGRPHADVSVRTLARSDAARSRAARVAAELDRWAELGVDGHFPERAHAAAAGTSGWLDYHEASPHRSRRSSGARRGEIVAMNTLTVNLHLMLVELLPRRRARATRS